MYGMFFYANRMVALTMTKGGREMKIKQCAGLSLLCIGLVGGAFAADVSPGSAASAPGTKQRLIVLSDIEADPDDSQSFVRLFLYANEIDI
jgi:hypothetical protein